MIELTKREYFAALAMQAMFSNHAWISHICQKEKELGNNDWEVTACEDAVAIADGLIKALEK